MYHMVQRIDVTARSTAGPETVYRLLADGSSWPTWSPIGSFELGRPGASPERSSRGRSNADGSSADGCSAAGRSPDGSRPGLGEIRTFRTGRTASCERVVELVPGRRL